MKVGYDVYEKKGPRKVSSVMVLWGNIPKKGWL